MVPITPGTKPDLKERIRKALEEKGIDPRAYEKYMKRNMTMPTSTSHNDSCLLCLPPEGKRDPSLDTHH